MSFLCILCDEVRPNTQGAHDAVERVLGDFRGVCDSCWAKLPSHVLEWADEYDARATERTGGGK